MGVRGGIGVPIELPITSARLTSPFIVDVWVAAISGRIDRLVLDPTQIAASDWAPLLWLSKTYHVPVELRVEDSSPTVACAMAEATDNCLAWGANWWEVEHSGVVLPISPRVSWILRALSTGAQDVPIQLEDVNRQLLFWGQPPVTHKNFRGIIRAIRFRVPGHVTTSRGRGYLWHPCTPQNEFERQA